MSIRAEAFDIASRQHGVVATWQLRWAGTAKAITHELQRSGNWVRCFVQVFRLTGARDDETAQLMAALLAYGPGAAVALDSAAAMWEFPGFERTPAHVVRTKSTNSTVPGADVHRHESRRLPADDLTVVDGFVLTTPTRTLIDLARRLHPGRVERLLDSAWSRRLTDARSIVECCDRLRERGRPEVRLMRQLVDKRGSDWVPPASGLESRLNWLLDQASIGQIRRQVNVGGTSWLGRVDFLHGSGVIIEVQSDRFHAALTSQLDDAARFDAMREAGYDVVEVGESEIWQRPEEAVARIRAAIVKRKRS